jgi:hypothetical protein
MKTVHWIRFSLLLVVLYLLVDLTASYAIGTEASFRALGKTVYAIVSR